MLNIESFLDSRPLPPSQSEAGPFPHHATHQTCGALLSLRLAAHSNQGSVCVQVEPSLALPFMPCGISGRPGLILMARRDWRGLPALLAAADVVVFRKCAAGTDLQAPLNPSSIGILRSAILDVLEDGPLAPFWQNIRLASECFSP